MILTYKYRLLPTRKQHAALAQILEEQRWLYNAALQERMDAYRDPDAVRSMVATLAYRGGLMSDTAEYEQIAARHEEIEWRVALDIAAATRPILEREGWKEIKDCPRQSPVRQEIAEARKAARKAARESELAGRAPRYITNFDQTNNNTRCRQNDLIGADMSRLFAALDTQAPRRRLQGFLSPGERREGSAWPPEVSLARRLAVFRLFAGQGISSWRVPLQGRVRRFAWVRSQPQDRGRQHPGRHPHPSAQAVAR
jgi:hypothetical protein